MTLAAGLYAGVLPLYLFFRVRAPALALGEGTAAIVALQDDLARRNDALDHAGSIVRHLVESRTPPAADTVDTIRHFVTAGGVRSGARAYATVPLPLRVALARAEDAMTRLGNALAEEVARLAQHFNEMTRVLRDRAEEQGRFAAAGELLAGVAHEVNNPLMAIAAHAENRVADPAIAEEQRSEMQQILRQARRAAKLL